MPAPSMTRRNFVAAGITAGAAVTAVAATSPLTHAVSAEEAAADPTIPGFLVKPAPITEFAETHEYEIVVVGAGEAGLAAAHTAVEAGAKVAVVQNIDTPLSSGNMGASVDIEKTDEAGVAACVQFLMEKNAYRSNRDLIVSWANNSLEALRWWADACAADGIESKPFDAEREYNGYTYYTHANTYNHVEGAHNACCQVIAEQLAAAGVEFFYNHPAVQIQTAEDGSVTGVICTNADGANVLFTATKGVILATGDYSANEEMLDYYAPDTKGFTRGTLVRDGSGLRAGIWAGAQMVPTTHSKMIHGGGALTRLQVPFLNLNIHGERFMNETLSFAYLNNLVRDYMAEYDYANPMVAKFFTIMPSNWLEIAQGWVEKYPNEVQLTVGTRPMPDESEFISGETFEELAANINAYIEQEEWGIEPIDEQVIVDSINHYNEVCATGGDTDFGKRADYMVAIEQGPYFAVPRGANFLPAILGGLKVDGNSQCLDVNNNPIPGFFAVGNASGQFYGGVDYPMDIEGLSVGRAITSGYVTGRHVASL